MGNIKQVLEMAKPDFEQDEDGEWLDFEDEFRACIKPIPDDINNEDYIACGSARLEDIPTQTSLYRLLWLVQPKSVDFSDMYKTFLFGFMSEDDQFIVNVELFKYELGLYFYAKRNLVSIAGNHGIIAGHPGANNGWSLQEGVDGSFFDMVKAAASIEHCVYGGNNFFV